jgi:hypothetical protein
VVAAVEGESDGGGDRDWSEGRQGLIVSESVQRRGGEDNGLRLHGVQEKMLSANSPIVLGNISGDGMGWIRSTIFVLEVGR